MLSVSVSVFVRYRFIFRREYWLLSLGVECTSVSKADPSLLCCYRSVARLNHLTVPNASLLRHSANLSLAQCCCCSILCDAVRMLLATSRNQRLCYYVHHSACPLPCLLCLPCLQDRYIILTMNVQPL
jgi:hypothetical protein